MTGQLFKLVWNRRRANGLILLELILSFFGLCGVLTLAGDALVNWGKPLGFAYDNVWQLDIAMPFYMDLDDQKKQETWDTFEQMDLWMQNRDEIEALTPLPVTTPFSNSMMAYSTYIDGASKYVLLGYTYPDAVDVLRLGLVAGRWIEPGDADLNWEPVVLNRAYAEALFPGENPLGKVVPTYKRDGTAEPVEDGYERRVVGVIGHYRHRGELFAEEFVQFSHMRRGQEHEPPRNYLLRLRPGTSAEFEEDLLKGLHGVAPDFTFNVVSLSQLRERTTRDNLIPFMIFGTVAVFLLVMVGLGLLGVLWQSVTRRTEELGLRRAMGATRGQVRWQILGELLALTTVAVVVGGLIYLQLPILQIFDWISFKAYLLALTLALVVIYSVVVACGLYPSWMATKVQPAEALQYE